ncbi:hypothetical protein LCGC14_1302090 [marine sediment metagenome]|uniref:Uncharacterized protein n=1 Tax=marine sediment metagenome TaxID=412755 RepID=A0A0F9KQL5_9ZZZZ
MPKELQVERRFDFRGGRNTRDNPDLLQPNELIDITNGRLADTRGAIQVRLGSKRMHATTLGDSVTGVRQWTNNGTIQLVATANGDLHHKTSDLGNFTLVSPTPVIGTGQVDWTTMRQSTSGAPLRLYFADDTNVWRWSGAALTRLSTGASLPPANATHVKTFHIRNFYVDSDRPIHLEWSVLGDPEDLTVATGNGAGEAMMDVLSGEDIVSMEVIGSSLLVATTNSVVRFTGYSAADIQIAQDTEGVSSTEGCVGKLAFRRIEKFAAMLDTRGPYAVNEEEAIFLGDKIYDEFLNLDRSVLGASVVGYHPGRREIWWAVPGSGDSNLNKTVYIYNLDLGIWYGPFTYPFGITCFAEYEDSSGIQAIIAGCDDGFVRHMDVGTLDDVLADGTGGSTFTLTGELAPIFFANGPSQLSTLYRAYIQAEITTGVVLDFKYAFDEDSLTTKEVTGIGGSKAVNYRVDLGDQGDRLRIQFTVDEAAALFIIHGITLKAFDMLRDA